MALSKKSIAGFLSVLAAAAVYFLLGDTPEPVRRTAFIFILAALFWALEIIPLFATSIGVIVLLSLFLSGPGREIPYSVFLIPFSNPVIMLFLGGFILARAFQKYGLDRRLAAGLLRRFGARPFFVILGFMAATAFLGMWISNTAATALMLPMVLPLLAGAETNGQFKKALVLAIPFAARIGGITTPVGSPTNAVAIGLLAEHGVTVNFVSWALATLPLAVLLLILTSGILYFLFPYKNKPVEYVVPEKNPLNFQTAAVIAIGAVTVLMWFSSPWHGLPESLVALISVSLLTASRLIDIEDLKRIDWDILILMWGGLALGEGMDKSGFAAWVTSQPVFPDQAWQMYLMICVVTVLLSTFMSNTATVNLLIPIVLTLPGGDPAVLAAIVALSASFDLALPVSTPPMAMAYGTKAVSIGDMLKAGIVFAIFSNGLLLIGAEFMMQRVFTR